MKHAFTKEAKIGLVVIVSIVLLYIGVNYLKGINLFKPVNHYFVAFNNVKDLSISSPVYVEGYKVGLVNSISYDYKTTDRIIVEISLDKQMKVNKGSYVTMSNGMLSGAEIHLHLNKYVTEYLTSGSTLEGKIEGDMMGSVQNELLPGISQLIPKIDSVLVGLQTLVNHPALSQSLEHIEQSTVHLETSTRRLNQLLADDVPVVINDLKAITGNFSIVSDNLKDLDLKSTMKEIDQTLANLKLTTGKLNSTDNTFGLLLNDTTLYRNLGKMTENASSLLFDVKENPKRYVHFSLF